MSVEVLKVVRHHGKLNRATVLVDGSAVTYRSTGGRRWKCCICHVQAQADCRHVHLATHVLRERP